MKQHKIVIVNNYWYIFAISRISKSANKASMKRKTEYFLLIIIIIISTSVRINFSQNGKTFKIKEVKMTFDRRYVFVRMDECNDTHVGDVIAQFFEQMARVKLNIKVFVSGSQSPLMEHTVNWCLLDREMNSNILAKMVLQNAPNFYKAYKNMKCPVQKGTYIMRNASERIKNQKLILPGFNYPEVTLVLNALARVGKIKKWIKVYNNDIKIEFVPD